MREQILARQIKLGIVPKGTKLAPKPEAIPGWETLSADETADVSIDLATPVVADIGAGRNSRFTGRIPELTVEVR